MASGTLTRLILLLLIIMPLPTHATELSDYPIIIAGYHAIGVGSRDVNAVFLVTLIFHNDPSPDPEDAGDINCDCTVNVGDAFYPGNFVYQLEDAVPCADCLWLLI